MVDEVTIILKNSAYVISPSPLRLYLLSIHGRQCGVLAENCLKIGTINVKRVSNLF